MTLKTFGLALSLLLLVLPGCAPGGTASPSGSAIQEVAPEKGTKKETGPPWPAPATTVAPPGAAVSTPADQPQGSPAAQSPGLPPRRELPTAEQAPQEPATAQPQVADPQPLPDYNLPPEHWAAQELARRGFVRNFQKKLVVLDPGHGGPEVGAAQGALAEKHVNLQIARKLRELLEGDGFQVLLTREADQRVYLLPEELSLNPRNPLRADLQGRVDLANAARADLFISLHNNGSSNPAEAGTEVWYAPDRPFGDKNWLLAREVLAGMVSELQAVGYDPPNRGLKNGSQFRVFRDRVFPLFVLGNPRTEPRPTRATLMPGILGESLFLSNAYEASLLAQERIQQAIAQGYHRGILRYFGLSWRVAL